MSLPILGGAAQALYLILCRSLMINNHLSAISSDSVDLLMTVPSRYLPLVQCDFRT